jgi:hypothetical protein
MNSKSLSVATAVALLFIGGAFVGHATTKLQLPRFAALELIVARGKAIVQRRRMRRRPKRL